MTLSTSLTFKGLIMRLDHLIIILLVVFACGRREDIRADLTTLGVRVADSVIMPGWLWQEMAEAERMRGMGLVRIKEVVPDIRVDLKYATAANFTGKVLYRNLRQAYLLPEVAEGVKKAQQELKKRHPGWSLIVYDAARPMSVQQEMWNVVKGTPAQRYVSNPTRGGGLHNYGAAVDLSVVDSAGIPIDMGSEFDYFGEEARVDREEALIAAGKLSAVQLQNRLLLREVMTLAGFKVLPGEWWHFNWMSRRQAVRELKVID